MKNKICGYCEKHYCGFCEEKQEPSDVLDKACKEFKSLIGGK